jgi:hypothetical protein
MSPADGALSVEGRDAVRGESLDPALRALLGASRVEARVESRLRKKGKEKTGE